MRKHGGSGKLLMSRRPPGSPERGDPPFSGGHLATEGARVNQVGEELPRRAVAR
jgi:hypothetical protein